MSSSDTVIIFSHGFGIRKDNLGLFTYLSEKFEETGFKTNLFDYYEYNEDTKEVYTIPFSKQAEILQNQIEKVKNLYPGFDIKIVCHSQGSLIPTLIEMSGVTQVIGISPFFLTNKEKVLERYNSRAGSSTDFSKVSRRLHSDGKVTVIPPEYWTERFNIDQFELYNALGSKLDLTLICGDKDGLALEEDKEKVNTAKVITIEGDHDFSGEYKKLLYEVISKIIN
jgi:hypothetical protein